MTHNHFDLYYDIIHPFMSFLRALEMMKDDWANED